MMSEKGIFGNTLAKKSPIALIFSGLRLIKINVITVIQMSIMISVAMDRYIVFSSIFVSVFK